MKLFENLQKKSEAKKDFNTRIKEISKTISALLDDIDTINYLIDYCRTNIIKERPMSSEPTLDMVVRKVSAALESFDYNYDSFLTKYNGFEEISNSEKSIRKDRVALKKLTEVKSKIDHKFELASCKFKIQVLSPKKEPINLKFEEILNKYNIGRKNEDIATV